MPAVVPSFASTPKTKCLRRRSRFATHFGIVCFASSSTCARSQPACVLNVTNSRITRSLTILRTFGHPTHDELVCPHRQYSLRCEVTRMAQGGHSTRSDPCPLLRCRLRFDFPPRRV